MLAITVQLRGQRGRNPKYRNHPIRTQDPLAGSMSDIAMLRQRYQKADQRESAYSDSRSLIHLFPALMRLQRRTRARDFHRFAGTSGSSCPKDAARA